MSFGGSVAAMIVTIKNNKRARVSTFDKIKKLKKSIYPHHINNHFIILIKLKRDYLY